jgi:hypothetical protein
MIRALQEINETLGTVATVGVLVALLAGVPALLITTALRMLGAGQFPVK